MESEMDRSSRTLGLAVVALVALVIGTWLVARPGGESAPTTATAPTADTPAPKPTPPAQRSLVLSSRGHPLLVVREGAHVALRTGPSPDAQLVKTVGSRTEWGSHRVLAVEDTQDGWAAVPTPLLPNGQLAWVRLDARSFRAQWTPYSVSVDLSERRAALLRGDRVLRSFSVTVGAPGSETPTGRFAVTDSFRGGLNPAYGCCAIALTAHQPHLPSGWLGGNRIAIHGTSGPLGVALSHGCVRAADSDVRALVKRLPAGTPVTIAE
jgi:hypothetical protein